MKLIELKAPPNLAISIPSDAIERRDTLLAAARRVEAMPMEVVPALAMELSAKVSGDIQAFCSGVEADRVAINKPLLAFQRILNAHAHELTDELEKRRKSLNAAQGDYIQLQEAKRKSLEAAQREELLAVERKREAKLAECDTIEAREAVQEEYSAKVAEMAPPVVSAGSVAGQRVTEDIDFEVTDIWLLVSSHPNLVKTPEPKRNEIKAHIKAGLPVKGVRWWPKTSVTNVGTAPRMTISLPPAKLETVGITID